MVSGPFFEVQTGGLDCILCCPVFKDCDCDIISCVMDYVELVKNLTREQPLGVVSGEVTKAGLLLVGFAAQGTYFRPQIDGVVRNTFGRTLVRDDINFWGTPGTEWRKWFTFILRVLDNRKFEQDPLPILKEKFLLDGLCNCDQAQAFCDALECIFDGMRQYLEIGTTNNPPYTLEEWERALCGVCYKDPCTCDNIVRPITA